MLDCMESRWIGVREATRKWLMRQIEDDDVEIDMDDLEGMACDFATGYEQGLRSSTEGRFFDFSEVLFSDVTGIMALIGKASKKEFETLPAEYALMSKERKEIPANTLSSIISQRG